MSKLISILFLSILSISSLQNNKISITSNLPGDVYAGNKFRVELTIHKSSLKHYAMLEQRLPKGFSAIENQSGAANFSFKNGIVKFTWLRLPESSPLTLSYDIVVDKKMKKGKYTLPAEFVYIYRNQRGSVKLGNNVLNVYKKGDIISTNPNLPKDPDKIQCLRFTPEYSPERRGLIVQIMISRGNINSTAKIVETIPQGYSATKIDSKGALFRVKNNNVEFTWSKLPENKNFIVSYMLSPHKQDSPLPNITGVFRFLQNGGISDVVIEQRDYKGSKKKKKKKDVKKKDVIDYFGY